MRTVVSVIVIEFGCLGYEHNLDSVCRSPALDDHGCHVSEFSDKKEQESAANKGLDGDILVFLTGKEEIKPATIF